jgi:hypothetical protein
MDKSLSSREAILADVRAALAGHDASPLQTVPASARYGPRKAAILAEEMEMMLREVEWLSGHGRRVRG